MATYNGEKYVTEQLDSLINQTYKNFKVIICDDCSTDNTMDILRKYESNYPNLFQVYQNEKNSTSAKYNFMDMMIQYKDDYVMLCDQDDVWMPDKIEVTFKAMKDTEAIYGKDASILVHTDAVVTDSNLNKIDSSLKHMIGAPKQINSLKVLCLQNHVTGCTLMYNKALAAHLLRPIGYFVMHDWLIAIIANCFGKIIYVDKSTLFYRQHSDNSMGAKNVNSLEYKINKIIHGKYVTQALFEAYAQCKTFLDMYYSILDDSQKDILETYSKMSTMNKLSRVKLMITKKMFRQGIKRKVSQIMFG